MSQLFYGSINVSELVQRAKEKHSGFITGNNGCIYANVSVWLNDKPDKFGNTMSIQVNPSKDKKDVDERFYIGNCKQSDGPKPVSEKDVSGLDLSGVDIPKSAGKDNQPSDDLPF